MPKSSIAISTPKSRISFRRSIVSETSDKSALSVISTSTPAARPPAAATTSESSRKNPSRRSCTVDTLTAIRGGARPFDRQRAMSSIKRASTNRPVSMINPVSSSSATNCCVDTRPFSGSFQRNSASAPTTRRVTASTFG